MYILCRATGKYLGAMLGSHCCKAGKETKQWVGIALLPQAGVAIGMALVASEHYPEYRQILLSVINAYSGSLGGGGAACSLPLDGFTMMVLG